MVAAASNASIRADADIYVSASRKHHGKRKRLIADRFPRRRAYLRFRLPVGAIEQVRLRVFSRRGHALGFDVRRARSSRWSERGAGSLPKAIGAAVQSGPLHRRRWISVDLTRLVRDGPLLTLVVTTASRRAVKLASRERRRRGPRLIVVSGADSSVVGPPVATATPYPADLTTIASSGVGSSEPTYFASNHRVAMTERGRQLVVHGRHAQGVQLAWRDPGGGWRIATRGATTSGALLAGTMTGDWPASIAIARDAAGVEHAWVVWGRATMGAGRSVQMTRLSELDSPSGPLVGDPVTVDDGASGGAVRPDVGFERESDGGSRGVVTWTRAVGTDSDELVAAWFGDLGADNPSFEGGTVLDAASSSIRGGTVLEASGGVRIVARAGRAALTVFAHDHDSGPASWRRTQGAPMQGYPSAAVLDSGEILAVGESNLVGDVVTVQRFSADGTPGLVELDLTGYREPTIASDGERAWLVMVRASDGFVVSRELTPASGWSTEDRVEIESVLPLWFPNALRSTDGRLRLVVGQRAVTEGTAAVLAYSRGL